MTTIVVTAAVVEQEGRFLVTERPPGVHLAGYWEFPGGKCEDGEALAVCLARELKEELGVEASIEQELMSVTHGYEDRRVELHFFTCQLIGTPVPLLGQALRWVARSELRQLEFPPADSALIERLISMSYLREKPTV
ncbi:MAG TPA: (deoxy)nucleoside triphosphate pyrophosphohydrolase [Vicinamibacterales bacterium]|nr:(deoxy)nucleoside triphosphate pyrophosphohydrolase [Vicinamibacterales bacterium]